MSEKELEERVLIDKSQFLEIEKYIQENFPNAKVIHQKNRYLDDNNLTLRKAKNVLRIRSFIQSKNRELTYKLKGDEGDIEHNQIISHYWYYQITTKSRLPEGIVKQELIKDGIDINSLKVLVTLYTRRMEVEFDDHTLVLDTNLYNNIVDYNIEVESKISKSHATEVILKYCKQFSLEYKKGYITKSNRAFLSVFKD